MSEDFAWFLLAVLVAMAVIGLVLVAVLGYVVIRYRPRVMAVLAAIGAIVYGLSPIDAVPEAFVGPAGTLDDLAVWAVAGYALYREVQRRRAEERAGSGPPGEPAGSTGDGSDRGGSPRGDRGRGPRREPGTSRIVVGEVVEEDTPGAARRPGAPGRPDQAP